MVIIIDRTNEPNRHDESRKRFLARVKDQIFNQTHFGRGLDRMKKMGHGKFNISNNRTIEEPFFVYETHPEYNEIVVVGNHAFNKNDFVDDFLEGNGSGSGQGTGSGSGDGEDDDLKIDISEQELADIIFSYLELPNLKPKRSEELDMTKYRHAGYIKYGLPSNINIYRSYKESFSRRIASKGVVELEIKQIEEDLKIKPTKELEERLIYLKEKLKNIPFFDESDLRYNTRVPVVTKVTKAVVFIALDVSGSVTDSMKELAKRFFYLVYLFLNRTYPAIETVFIIHTDKAKEVSQDQFFKAGLGGGTSLIEPWKLISKLIDERYSRDVYNCYMFHASDSDFFENPEEIKTELKKVTSKLEFGCYAHLMDRGVDMHNPSLSYWARKINTISSAIANIPNFEMGYLGDLEDPLLLLMELFGGDGV